MSDADDKKFSFTCPECFVSLKAHASQAGARLTCPSCSASIVVPDAPAARSIAGQTDRTIDSSAAEAAGGYDLATPTRSASEEGRHPASKPPQNTTNNTGYNIQASQATPKKTPDLITVTCHICATRLHTQRKNLGKKLRCTECGTTVPIVEAPKSQEQMRKPQKIDEAHVGEYGVSDQEQAGANREVVTIPFDCRLCGTLLRGTNKQVGKALVCPDCGTKTVVPPPQKAKPKAFIGAAAGTDLGEYGLSEPNVPPDPSIPVVCSLCSSRLMARPDQVGTKIQCPDCGRQTEVKPLASDTAGAVMGVMAHGDQDGAEYNVHAPPSNVTTAELIFECPQCKQRMSTATKFVGCDVACPKCGTTTRVPEQKTPPTKPAPEKQEVAQIGVDCPRCGTRIHATNRQVGKKVPCPDCDMPITIPSINHDSPATDQVVDGGADYGVSAPQEVLHQTVRPSRAPASDPVHEPADDPDFDFLNERDGSKMGWWTRDRSDKFGFIGHPDASRCWLGFSIGGVFGFALVAISLILYAIPSAGLMTGTVWFCAGMALAIGGIVCLVWAALLSGNLVAILQDTSAGNRIVESWPEGDWTEQIGESFYIFNSCMVSFIPVTILLQTYPPARPFAVYLYLSGFWLTLPVALFSMLETGSVLTPISSTVLWSLLKRPGAWTWLYLRSLVLIALTLAIHLALWLYVCGPVVLPLLTPMTTALAMIYARWLGILGQSIREVIEEANEE